MIFANIHIGPFFAKNQCLLRHFLRDILQHKSILSYVQKISEIFCKYPKRGIFTKYHSMKRPKTDYFV